mmetsp:Transcript_1541/g.4218  ORF Transcript_1541/g.4218 Transcript_1541/m.4218 type:complete len:345 (+) Transcript_1541:54-1088(+)
MAATSAEALAVFGSNVVKTLPDKSYEKRKIAAQEVEQLIRSYYSQQHPGNTAHEKTRAALELLVREYLENPLGNYRKGGLIGLASVAIGLEAANIQTHLDLLVPPILKCFSDPESRVRYYACESLYNVAKVARHDVLKYFNDIFDGLCKLFADVDVEVKNGAQYLDRLIKDIVTECPAFNVAEFISLLSQRIRVLNPYVRQLMLSWITILDSVPDVDMLSYLPQFLEGLFSMLADTNRDIRHGADACLSEFLNEIKQSGPKEAESVIGEVAKIVVKGCKAAENFCRLTALVWLHDFVEMGASISLQPLYPALLDGVLHCVDDSEEGAQIDKIGKYPYSLSLGQR